MFKAELIEYHSEHNDWLPPATGETKQLNKWVTKQRQFYNKGEMDKEREKKLRGVGFDFGITYKTST